MGSRGKSLSESARRIANKNHKGDSLISEEKATDGYPPNQLFDELRRTNTKFSEPDTVFITRDQEGKITWLERGSEGSGLKHIVERHSGQFEQAFGIKISEIPNHIQEVIEKGRITYSTPDKGGTRREYLYKGKYLTVIITGGNGFIITAFPSD